MRQLQRNFEVNTRGKGLYDVTSHVKSIVEQSAISVGLCTVFVKHTSASLLIQENADPEVLHDLERFFSRLVPEGDSLFRHTEEGPDDMPGHVRAALTQTSLGIPVSARALCLGTWQGLYLYEHRNQPHTRTLLVHVVGD